MDQHRVAQEIKDSTFLLKDEVSMYEPSESVHPLAFNNAKIEYSTQVRNTFIYCF